MEPPNSNVGPLISTGRCRSGIARDQKSAARDPSPSEALAKLSGAAQNIFDAVADAFGLARWPTNGRMSIERAARSELSNGVKRLEL